MCIYKHLAVSFNNENAIFNYGENNENVICLLLNKFRSEAKQINRLLWLLYAVITTGDPLAARSGASALNARTLHRVFESYCRYECACDFVTTRDGLPNVSGVILNWNMSKSPFREHQNKKNLG